MLRSVAAALVSRSRLKNIEVISSTCVSCREKRKIVVDAHIRSIPEERKHITQLDGLDLNRLQPQYRHIKALENAPEDVRKVFTLEFGGIAERMESRFLDYAEKLQRHRHDHDSLEMRIARLTLEIRSIQEKRTRMLYEPTLLRKALKIKFKQRSELLLELRSQNFEKFCLTVEVLDLSVVHGPQYETRYTKRAANLVDMKTRAFAEIRRRESVKASKSAEVSKLQEEILEKLKSGELQPPSTNEIL